MLSDLQLALLDTNFQAKRAELEKQTFDCSICQEPKSHCCKIFPCGHVSCVLCLQDFYNNCITEGDVNNINSINFIYGKDTVSQRAR